MRNFVGVSRPQQPSHDRMSPWKKQHDIPCIEQHLDYSPLGRLARRTDNVFFAYKNGGDECRAPSGIQIDSTA